MNARVVIVAAVALAFALLGSGEASGRCAPPPDSGAGGAAAPKVDDAPSPIMADDPKGGELLQQEEPKIQARVERIEKELKGLDRKSLKDDDWAKEWAGVYYEGDGLGTNVTIRLAPKSGIGYLNYGCLGLYGGDHGDIVEAYPDGLKVKLAIGKAGGSYLTERLYFVRWGDQRYLVPDWGLMRIVNNYNEGGFARAAMFGVPRLRKEGEPRHRFDEGAPAGKPTLPPEYAKLLRGGGIKMKVSKVTGSPRKNVTNGVDVEAYTFEFATGSDDGVYVGMEFWYPSDQIASTGRVEIMRVDAKTSTGKFQAFLSAGERVTPPKVGDEISTMRSEIVLPKKEENPPAEAPKKDDR